MLPLDDRELMRRTMRNLEHIEQIVRENCAVSGGGELFEVTQLVNSFLGGLAHPWELLKPDLIKIPIDEAVRTGWPRIETLPPFKPPTSLNGLLRLVRNAFAHGNIKYLGNHGEIEAVRIWNEPPPENTRTWSAEVSIEDLRAFLDKFVELAHEPPRRG